METPFLHRASVLRLDKHLKDPERPGSGVELLLAGGDLVCCVAAIDLEGRSINSMDHEGHILMIDVYAVQGARLIDSIEIRGPSLFDQIVMSQADDGEPIKHLEPGNSEPTEDERIFGELMAKLHEIAATSSDRRVKNAYAELQAHQEAAQARFAAANPPAQEGGES